MPYEALSPILLGMFYTTFQGLLCVFVVLPCSRLRKVAFALFHVININDKKINRYNIKNIKNIKNIFFFFWCLFSILNINIYYIINFKALNKRIDTQKDTHTIKYIFLCFSCLVRFVSWVAFQGNKKSTFSSAFNC